MVVFNFLYKISINAATKILLILFFIISIFHILVMFGAFRPDIIWGGKLESNQQLLIFESISLLANLIFLYIIASYSNIVKPIFSAKTYKIIFSILTIVFFLNSVGNIFAENIMETIIFLPITLLIFVMFLRLTIEK